MPANARELGIDETSPAYRLPEVTPAFRLKDTFLWNLHEALTTPDHFAKTLVEELDLPVDKRLALITQIGTQIRTQLEDYSQAALHPLFNPAVPTPAMKEAATKPLIAPAQAAMGTPRDNSHTSTPAPATVGATPLTNGASNGISNGVEHEVTNGKSETTIAIPQPTSEAVSASAVAVSSDKDVHNPDDTYRCVIELRINLMNKLYSDKFEWSLLHPPGFAEAFARQTCADLGLNAEWVSAMTHAIYEAVYRLRKESLDNGLPGAYDIDTDAAEGEAGWRYEPERLALEWAPIIESLTKDEIEFREKERERNMRRMRRETNRYVALPMASSFFADPTEEQPMGRGERSKKKRRFRSLSPTGRDTPDGGAYGGGTALTDQYVVIRILQLMHFTNLHTGNDGPGVAIIAGSGVPQSGPFVRGRMVHVLSAIIVVCYLSGAASYLRGPKTCLLTSGLLDLRRGSGWEAREGRESDTSIFITV